MKHTYLAILLFIVVSIDAFAQQSKTEKDINTTTNAVKDIGSLFKKKNKKPSVKTGDTSQTDMQNASSATNAPSIKDDNDLHFPEGIFASSRVYSIVIINGVLYNWGSYGAGTVARGVDQTPVNFTPAQITTDNDWRFVTTDEGHSFAIKTDGTLWAWGWQNRGEMGFDMIKDRWLPVPTRVGRDTDWSSVSTAFTHTVAIKTNGTLWVCGLNINSELGVGPTTNSVCEQFTQVGKDHDWVKAAAGAEYTLAIKKDGTLWAWGMNTAGDLGTPTVYQVQTVPIQIGTDKDWAKVFALTTNFSSFAIKADGTLWSWGAKGGNILGRGPIRDNSNLRPGQVGTDKDWVTVTIGYSLWLPLGLKKDGSVWTWGNPVTPLPHNLKIPGKWAAITVANAHAALMKSDGSVWTAGNNGDGELGAGLKDEIGINLPQVVEVKFPTPVITTKPKAVLATVMNDETKVLFNNVRSKLSIKDKNAIAKLLDFPLSRNKKQFILNNESADYPFDILVYPTDLNKDGVEEIFLTYGNSYTSGLTGSNVMLFTRDTYGDWHKHFGFPGTTPDVLSTGKAGYPDLLIGISGQTLSVWRWDGNEYKLNRNIADADAKKLRASNIKNISSSYVNAQSK